MMGRRTTATTTTRDFKSPSHSFSSSSSSDFEFIISSLSPRKTSSTLCPADDLFYKGKLLPLHLSPRLSMVRTLFLASSSTSSSSDTNTTASRDSTGSTNSTDSTSSFTSDIVLLNNECDSSRPSSVTEEDEFKRFKDQNTCLLQQIKKPSKYFSLARFSSVFKKDNKQENGVSGSSVKRAKEVFRKYVNKVKPLYEKLSQKQHQQQEATAASTENSVKEKRDLPSTCSNTKKDTTNNNSGIFSNSFSGNIRYPRRKSSVLSCPSSMRSSPNHSGVLCRTTAVAGGGGNGVVRSVSSSGTSSMEELQNAIQGAIAHCKNSMMVENKSLDFSNKYFNHIYKPISLGYNLVLAMLWQHSENLELDEVKGCKPWRYTGKEANMDREDIKELVAKWWDIYDESLNYKSLSEEETFSSRSSLLLAMMKQLARVVLLV